MIICPTCNREFKSQTALSGHVRVHQPDFKSKTKEAAKKAQNTLRQTRLEELEIEKVEYEQNPNHCEQCDVIIPFERKYARHCSRTCATITTNKKRKITDAHREKTSNTLKSKTRYRKSKVSSQISIQERIKQKPKLLARYFKKFVEGPYTLISNKPKLNKPRNDKKVDPYKTDVIYSKVHLNKCKHCLRAFVTRKRQMYCTEHLSLYERGAKTPFQFNFNINDYPDLFDLEQIAKIGWYNPHTGHIGLTRDHKISICDAIRFNYDPYYISHPINCEIVSQRQNASKGRKSAMSYEDLVKKVKEYDSSKQLYTGSASAIRTQLIRLTAEGTHQEY